MGSDAVIVGTDGQNLHFSSVRAGSWPELFRAIHAKALRKLNLESWFLLQGGRRQDGHIRSANRVFPLAPDIDTCLRESAAILFLRNDSLTFREVG